MASKGLKENSQEPLSNYQDLSKTGRQDVRDDVDTEEEDPFWKDRNYRITEATLKDGLCNYSYEIISGIGIGDTHTVKGSALYERDLAEAFSKFNVHMAVIDDAFKAKEIEVKDIDREHNHELATLYSVNGFKIKGSEESESIVLVFNKYISYGGRLETTTPKIPLDNFSSYRWREELKAAADRARKEVALYREGKCTPVEQEEDEKPKLKQTKMFGNADVKVTVTAGKPSDELDDDFAEAAL